MKPYNRDWMFILSACVVVVLLALWLPAAHAQTIPKIASDPYKVDGFEPDACACQAPNAPALTCGLVAGTGTVQPVCNIGSIVTAGTYNVTITVTRKEKITNTAGGGQFVPAASATSAPFAYTRGGVALSLPTNLGLTIQ